MRGARRVASWEKTRLLQRSDDTQLQPRNTLKTGTKNHQIEKSLFFCFLQVQTLVRARAIFTANSYLLWASCGAGAAGRVVGDARRSPIASLQEIPNCVQPTIPTYARSCVPLRTGRTSSAADNESSPPTTERKAFVGGGGRGGGGGGATDTQADYLRLRCKV